MANSDKPTILVTGAGGATAKKVITLLQHDYNIVAVDFRRQIKLGKDIPSYLVDITKRGFEDIFRNHKIDGVIHMGRVGTHSSNRRSRYNTNVIGTQRLFDRCRKYGVKQVLVMSTFFVYGADAYNPALLDEDTPFKAAELTLDLVDAVELENLANIYLYKYPELNITILRPCHIAGPGVRNSMSTLLSSQRAPVLMGFSPMMQFIHVDDMGEAIAAAYKGNKPGVYNVAPEDYIAYQDALSASGCKKAPLPSVPPALPLTISKLMGWRAFPSYLINYFKYPVVLDGSLFEKTFNYKPKHSYQEIFTYYRQQKELLK
ncbi:nucleoside-diphosphate-sugar epimerase [gamma proteobacterium HTCC5015]|nr:nucleoside-diphosphate-sugar epimerase [gamma proteobacterium HTCC5015]